MRTPCQHPMRRAATATEASRGASAKPLGGPIARRYLHHSMPRTRAKPGDLVVDPATQRIYRVVVEHPTGWLTVSDARGRVFDIGPHREVVRKRISGTIPKTIISPHATRPSRRRATGTGDVAPDDEGGGSESE